jgi:hypothetical protein
MLPLDCRQRSRMAFHPERVFNIEVAGIATIVLSVAVVACVLFSIWATS